MNHFLHLPILTGALITLRPLRESDFDALYLIAKDSLLWEQHPQSNRYQLSVYQKLFQEFIESKMTFVIIENTTQKIIGSSRFYDFQREEQTIVIGYTMLSRDYWGGLFKNKKKKIMCDYAFQFVNSIIFHVGENNFRSRKALVKIGAKEFSESVKQLPDGKIYKVIHYRINKGEY
mgnify:FL=1